METVVLLLFCGMLLCCVLLDFSILYALVAGFFLFCAYGLYQRHSVRELFAMALSGVKTIRNILLVFVLIGMLTALWRAAGTIPVIVCCASKLIRPSVFLLMAFLLNCSVSVLTGTAFGTVATMGVICMTIANAMEISSLWSGGAILAGVFFGDRCSPVSTSALLVSELTGTNIFTNIKKMCRTALIPFLLSCAVYTLVGFRLHSTADAVDVHALFSGTFSLHWLALLPAAAILVLSASRVNVKISMLVSIACAIVVCLSVQKTAPLPLLHMLVTGFHSGDPEIAKMLDGGGILSMVRVGAIVCISSSYAGLFKGTGLLDRIQEAVVRLGSKITPYGSIILTAAVTSMVACNQTLAIMLTHQLCGTLASDPETFAVDLEDTAVVIAPLIPWSIAAAVPVAAVGASNSCIFAACFLYLLPICGFLRQLIHKKKEAGRFAVPR